MDKWREPSLLSGIYFTPSPATGVSRRREVGLGEAFGSRFKKEISFPDSVFARRQLRWEDVGSSRGSGP